MWDPYVVYLRPPAERPKRRELLPLFLNGAAEPAPPPEEDDADQDAAGVEGQSSDAAAQKSRMREASFPAEARVENAAASGAESGESLAKKKAGCGRLLRTFRFQYRMNAAFTVNGFTAASTMRIHRRLK
ncbi:uncharacterized protein LOC101771664 [Setaria italica]|uniref:uncharacterized protein LOC101771664 n=1 Tax=Setaria italica TaxID=4555 RepID=UPI000351253F|nr:uncharacterized protein LOC101771664 [Setaria italica]